MTPAQCRMGRAAIELGVRELAEAAQVSTNTVTRFERGEPLKDRTVAAIRAALEAAGVEFIPENGGGAGVRIKHQRIEVAQRPDGSGGVLAFWTVGASPQIVSSITARDHAVAAQRRGDTAWAKRVIAAAEKADAHNNDLDENGNAK
jgi:hypothetical protein